MQLDDAKVGTPVETLQSFSGVPAGTVGMIDEDYGSGVMVAWHLPDRYLPLTPAYRRHDANAPIQPGAFRLRDGFDKEKDLVFLRRMHEDEYRKRLALAPTRAPGPKP